MRFTSTQYKQIAQELTGLRWPSIQRAEAIQIVADYVMIPMPWKPIYRDGSGNILSYPNDPTN